jgi:hypothetical protein
LESLTHKHCVNHDKTQPEWQVSSPKQIQDFSGKKGQLQPPVATLGRSRNDELLLGSIDIFNSRKAC